MPTIAVLAPSETIGQRALAMADQLKPFTMAVYEGNNEKVEESAAQAVSDGAAVVVARGAAAAMVMRTMPDIPVVSIPVSGQDLVKALDEAKRLTGRERPRIGLMTFPAILADMEYLADLLNIDLHVYHLQEGGNSHDRIRKAKRDGVDIVIAGNTTGRLVRQHGLLTVFLDSGDISLSMALLEARRVAQVRVMEQVNVQKFRTILEVSRDGALLLNPDGQIEMANQAALNILQLGANPMGTDAAAIFSPEILSEVLSNGKAVLDEVVSFAGNTILVSITPLRAEGSITGAIASLQKTEAISALGAKIRKSLMAKGMLSQYTFASIQGASPQIRRAVSLARKYAATDNAVLIVGETGTGKELFAQAIHDASQHRHGPFVAVNCAALPPTLLESELFGYEEGAFTGARRQGKPGLFELANGGTIFLDEISEMDHYGQTRLLRVLQERSSLRLGADKYTALNARVIAASNRDLYEYALAGKFREDLLYRLNTLTLSIPPLREREGDIVHLARLFAREHAPLANGHPLALPPALLERLLRHPWPGNIRELSSVIERLALLAEDGHVDMNTLEEALRPTPILSGKAPSTAIPAAGQAETAFRPDAPGDERQTIVEALEAAGGNQIQAARLLGIHRGTLHRKMRKYAIRRAII
ncbi:putative Sigma54 specific transcriptional regulator, Fis family [uncultured delta proteobacterium]|uniref:Putative Sigma54 specific transcriptional regulator, Fis family n=1 Tax=uncultured delta proteobacterium TaxID=34034 RepID=A0A212K9U8_9DELT|nr:putative Sigma54 specific transcriptional regulator, Fis family [uncultured delta proteobacterium]